MKSRLLQESNGERIFAIIFDRGEEVVAGLQQFASESNISAAYFTAIGGFEDVTLGFFDFEQKDYLRRPIKEQLEVLSLIGNVCTHQDKPKIHAHVVLGKRDSTAHGGHLLEAHVRPTLEVMLTETPAHLERGFDKHTGLALIRH